MMEDKEIAHYVPGMSLRQWYAGMALPSVINKLGLPINQIDQTQLVNGQIAHIAYRLADAMILEGEK